MLNSCPFNAVNQQQHQFITSTSGSSKTSFSPTHLHTITFPSFSSCDPNTQRPVHTLTHLRGFFSPLPPAPPVATSCGRALMEALHPETITIRFHIFRHDTFISRLLSGEQVGGNHIGRLLNGRIDIGAGCINCFMERWFNTGRLQFLPSPLAD